MILHAISDVSAGQNKLIIHSGLQAGIAKQRGKQNLSLLIDDILQHPIKACDLSLLLLDALLVFQHTFFLHA
jgi:hypothetical protein